MFAWMSLSTWKRIAQYVVRTLGEFPDDQQLAGLRLCINFAAFATDKNQPPQLSP
jgi:hypothetical protein